MNRSRLDMNTASDSTPTMAVTLRFSTSSPVPVRDGVSPESGPTITYQPPVRPENQLTRYSGFMAIAQPRTCSIARTLDVIGEKWALLALREVFLGNRRFDEMVRRTGAPRDTLAARLRSLAGAGILERRQYSEHPARYEYRLTEAGRALYPVILPLMRWAVKHLAGVPAPPL